MRSILLIRWLIHSFTPDSSLLKRTCSQKYSSTGPLRPLSSSIVIVALGVLALLSLPVSQYPDITPPVVQVTATYTGADAQTVEQTVATPIETQVNGTPGMDYVQTNATNDGRMTHERDL